MEQPLPSPNPVFTFRPHSGEVTCASYADLGERQAILAGTSSGLIGIWDIVSKRQFWKQECDVGLIAAESINSKKIISLCRQAKLTVWDVNSEKAELTSDISNPGFCRFSLLPTSADGALSKLVVADKDHGKANIFNFQEGRVVAELLANAPKSKGMCTSVKSFELQAHVPGVLAGFEDGSVVLWDTRYAGKDMASVKLFSDPVFCLDYDSSRNQGVCGSPDDALIVFLINEQQNLSKGYNIPLRNKGTADVRIRGDSRIIASGGWDGRIRVFGWKKGKPLAALNYHSATVNCISFAVKTAPDEHQNTLICGSRDQRITLWKLY